MIASKTLLDQAIGEQYLLWMFWKKQLAAARLIIPSYVGDRTDYFHSAKALYDRLVEISRMTRRGQHIFDQLLNNPLSKDALHQYACDGVCEILMNAPSNKHPDEDAA